MKVQIDLHAVLMIVDTLLVAAVGYLLIVRTRKPASLPDILRAVVNTLTNKSRYYYGHSTRVSLISKIICDALSVRGKERENIIDAAYIHDFGKVAVDRSILEKNDKLTDKEQQIVRDHCIIGYDILKEFGVNPEILANVLYHHENYDGTGYPLGLMNSHIPLGARIIRIADSIDAMGSDRAYRPAMPFEKIKEELLKGNNAQFDPQIIKQVTNGLNKRIKLVLAQQRLP